MTPVYAFDNKNIALAVGDRVVIYGGDPKIAEDTGVIINITEPNTEYVDCLQTAITTSPHVWVTFDDGVEDEFVAFSQWPDNDNIYRCDDLERII